MGIPAQIINISGPSSRRPCGTRFDGQRWKSISSPPPSPSRLPLSRSSDYGILLLTFYVFAHYLRNCSKHLLSSFTQLLLCSYIFHFTLYPALVIVVKLHFHERTVSDALVMTDSSSSNTSSSSSLSDVVQSVFSYNGNVMLAALVSFLFVLLFVLLLHIYAKWFFTAHARHRRRRSITPSNLFIPPRLTNFHSSIFDSSPTDSRAKGLSPSAVAVIPVFVYSSEKNKNGSECVICLSAFEDSEIGRSLPECSHSFHIECIDMWLSCHSNCPVCRAPVADDIGGKMEAGEGSGPEGESRREILTAVQSCENEIIASAASASSSSAVSFECSLKRMLSRNRPEIKVFPTSGSPESDG